jgi:tetratricopeptide (TPR) repeat protein
MRLLRFDARDRLVLTDFRGKPIPPYAILSHRWSDSEALIEDVSNRKYEEREEGYQKLRFCAEQAAQDGLQYFWIDTCCIDRWDNNERSKAINSMFQWYRNAARCYVLLSDVSVSSATDVSQRSSWEASFRGSDWFTRGWTLQELIAPVTVEFFSREGYYLGDKTSLEQLLHEITNIPLAALRNHPLEQFSTSERQQWAKNRRTTEEEDILYCLFGLLGVSMPTTYGEGKQSALIRLQAEVEGASSVPSIIPFSRNESFVGREAQLAELEAKLFSNDQTTTLAILGPGGTGKSQLALEVAHRTRLNNKNCSVFWIDASDIDSLYRSYASVAQKLSIHVCNDDQADTKQIVKRCVAAMSARQCLLIYDNVEGTTLQPSGLSVVRAVDLTDFLPHSKLCSVIFTTTESNTAKTLALQDVVVLRELTSDTALKMLESRLTTPLSNAEQPGAMRLLRELSHLPLAVAQAAACMNASNMTVQQYQAQLHEHNQAALEHSNSLHEGEQGESSLRKAVAATLSLSISQVRQSNAVAADYLFVAACVDRKDISLDLLEAASLQAREDAVRLLDKYALISRRPSESAFDVHRLVYHALQRRMEAEGRLHEWSRSTITQLLRVFPNDDHSNRSKWRRLLPHACCVLSRTNRANEEERLELARKCAMALFSDGQYERSKELQVEVMQTSKRVLGNDHPYTLSSMAHLAVTFRSQGRWEEAKMLDVYVMETRRRLLGCEHPDTLMSMNNLANVLDGQGKYEEAEAIYRKTLVESKKVLGCEHPDSLASMNNLAQVLDRQDKYKEAEAMHRQTLAMYTKVLGCEHPDTLMSMNNLANVLDRQGKYEEAEAMHRRDLEVREKVLGREHPKKLMRMKNLASTLKCSPASATLGSVLESQGKYEEAEAMNRQTLAMREKALGREHPDTLTSVYCLAYLLARQHNYFGNIAEVMSFPLKS